MFVCVWLDSGNRFINNNNNKHAIHNENAIYSISLYNNLTFINFNFDVKFNFKSQKK